MWNIEISGNGEENLVLLHGFLENNATWEKMQPSLSDEFKIFAVEFPGHGKSAEQAGDYDFEVLVEQLAELLAAKNLDKFHLLGHSLGGYIALAFAKKFPEKLKSLCLFFSSSLADTEEKTETRRKTLPIIEKSLAAFVNSAIPATFGESEKEKNTHAIARCKQIALQTKPKSAQKFQLAMCERPETTEVLKNFPGKIFIFCGREDEAVETEKFWKKIPVQKNVKAYMLPCGHMGHWEMPEICAEIINAEILG